MSTLTHCRYGIGVFLFWIERGREIVVCYHSPTLSAVYYKLQFYLREREDTPTHPSKTSILIVATYGVLVVQVACWNF